MKKLLLVDDDANNRFAMREILKRHYNVVEADNGEDGIRMAVSESPDLVLLDVRMPGIDGFHVCERLRSLPNTRRVPVIFLTGDDGLDKRIKGLETGGDDYVCRPFHTEELMARIRARMRRHEFDVDPSGEIRVGNLRIDPKACETYIDDRQVRLTQMEFDLLRYFIERPNRVLQRAQVLNDLWPNTVVTDRTVDTHVAHLRKKLKGFSCPLTTVYKVGYMLKTG